MLNLTFFRFVSSKNAGIIKRSETDKYDRLLKHNFKIWTVIPENKINFKTLKVLRSSVRQ